MKKNLKKEKTPKLILVIAVLVLVLALVQLAISHQLATTGDKIRHLEKETSLLDEENRFLSEQISQIGSLSKISTMAEDLGLVRSTQVVHLTPQISVALR